MTVFSAAVNNDLSLFKSSTWVDMWMRACRLEFIGMMAVAVSLYWTGVFVIERRESGFS